MSTLCPFASAVDCDLRRTSTAPMSRDFPWLARYASASASLSASSAIMFFHGDGLAERGHNPRQPAGVRRFEIHRRLVGLDFANHLPDGDLVAFLDAPRNDRAFFHRVAGLRHQDRHHLSATAGALHLAWLSPSSPHWPRQLTLIRRVDASQLRTGGHAFDPAGPAAPTSGRTWRASTIKTPALGLEFCQSVAGRESFAGRLQPANQRGGRTSLPRFGNRRNGMLQLRSRRSSSGCQRLEANLIVPTTASRLQCNIDKIYE